MFDSFFNNVVKKNQNSTIYSNSVTKIVENNSESNEKNTKNEDFFDDIKHLIKEIKDDSEKDKNKNSEENTRLSLNLNDSENKINQEITENKIEYNNPINYEINPINYENNTINLLNEKQKLIDLNLKETFNNSSYNLKEPNEKSKNSTVDDLNTMNFNEKFKKLFDIKLLILTYISFKALKYFTYLLMIIFILILFLCLIKFFISKDSEEFSIKTKHSINEIEDELNSMKRDKLF